MRHLVVNCSAPYYNLGAAKLQDWLTVSYPGEVSYSDADPGLFGGNPDVIWLSVIFSWDAMCAMQIANRYKSNADVVIGGPGVFALGRWWREQTGLNVSKGLDPRFDRQRGNYRMTFASRGCPVGCYFCIVPKIEGMDFTLDWDFQPAPILCDNNLSALPVDFQTHIIKRYTETKTVLRDANSGFEPRTFDEDTYRRWKPILKGPWRFAFDEMSEAADVERMMKILKTEAPHKKQVYVLIGNEPIVSCFERASKILSWGGQPYVQPLMPLNTLSRNHLKIQYDWTEDKLRAFQRYYNRHVWRYCTLPEYNNRKHEKPLFSDLLPPRFVVMQEIQSSG